MTKDILKQYRCCKKRVHQLNRRIKKLQNDNSVRDTVQGSHKDYPYTMGHYTISGYPDLWNNHSELRNLCIERDKCKYIVDAVSRYIDSIEDNIIRRAISLKYVEGDVAPKWDKVALDIGGGNTAEGIRKAVTRFIQKN